MNPLQSHSPLLQSRGALRLAAAVLAAFALACQALPGEEKRQQPAASQGQPARPPQASAELREQLGIVRRELERSRDSLHEAHLELFRKTEAISTLEARADSLARQLDAARAELEKAAVPRDAHAPAPAPAGEKQVAALKEKLARAEEENRKLATRSAALQSALRRVEKQAADALAKSATSPAPAAGKPAPEKPPRALPADASSIAPTFFTARSAANEKDRPRVLREVRAALKERPGATVLLKGHADDTPWDQTNQEISGNRTRFLAAYLVQGGIPRGQIQTEALGAGGTPAPDGSRRRVDIEIRP